jgi:methionyl-tRNA synthetase
MSKTAGTAVSVDSAIERHGADALRYFLLREVGFENDGNFTWERFDARYTADLADTFGNLVSRTLSMVERYRNGIVPSSPLSGTSSPPDPLSPRERGDVELINAYTRAMDANALQEGAACIMELASRANRYVEETAPWKLAKEKRGPELDRVLVDLIRTVARLAILSAPFIPEKAAAIWSALGAHPTAFDRIRLAEATGLSVSGWRVSKLPPLFPKDGVA